MIKAVRAVGLNEQVAVIGDDPTVATETHPPIRFPLARKVTRPGALSVAVTVAEVRNAKEFGTFSVVVVSLIATAIKVITTLPAATVLLSASTLLLPAL